MHDAVICFCVRVRERCIIRKMSGSSGISIGRFLILEMEIARSRFNEIDARYNCDGMFIAMNFL